MLKCLVLRVGTIVSFPKWDAISRNVLVGAKNRAFLCCLEREETNEEGFTSIHLIRRGYRISATW